MVSTRLSGKLRMREWYRVAKAYAYMRDTRDHIDYVTYGDTPDVHVYAETQQIIWAHDLDSYEPGSYKLIVYMDVHTDNY